MSVKVGDKVRITRLNNEAVDEIVTVKSVNSRYMGSFDFEPRIRGEYYFSDNCGDKYEVVTEPPRSTVDLIANLARRVAALEAPLGVNVPYTGGTQTPDDKPNTSDVIPPQEYDNIEKPAHYNAGGVEVIDIIKMATAGSDPHTAYLVGNVIKYIMRRNHKHDSPVECMRKAEWYLRKAIEHETELRA